MSRVKAIDTPEYHAAAFIQEVVRTQDVNAVSTLDYLLGDWESSKAGWSCARRNLAGLVIEASIHHRPDTEHYSVRFRGYDRILLPRAKSWDEAKSEVDVILKQSGFIFLGQALAPHPIIKTTGTSTTIEKGIPRSFPENARKVVRTETGVVVDCGVCGCPCEVTLGTAGTFEYKCALDENHYRHRVSQKADDLFWDDGKYHQGD